MTPDDLYRNKYLKYKSKYFNLVSKANEKSNNTNINELKTLSTKVRPFTGIINKAFPFIKVGLSGAAEVASLGLGGDEAIELAFVVLDSLLISSELINLYNLKNIKQFTGIITDIMNLKFTGFNDLNNDYTNIMKKYNMLPVQIKDSLKKKLCKVFDDLLLKLSTMFGDLLSMGLPDDSDITSLLFQQYVKEHIDNDIDGILRHVVKKYESLPQNFIQLIEDNDKLEKLIYKTFKIILGLNTAKDMGIFAVVDPLTPLFTLILYKKGTIAKTINYIFALFIFILRYLDDNCNQNRK